MKKEIKYPHGRCSICNGIHHIDKWGWVQTCIGYFELNNLKYEVEKWNNAQLEKSKTKSKR